MIKVKLRTKAISGNKQSLYLDFYPAIQHPETGKTTQREFLNQFIYNEIELQEQKYIAENGNPQIRFVPVIDRNNKPKKTKLNPIEKLHNKQTLERAEQVRQKRDNQLNKPEIYTGFEKEQLKIRERGELSFIDYFKKLVEKREASNHDNWVSALHYLEKFTKGNLKFTDLNETFCNDFKDYLLSTPSKRSNKTNLSQNSAVSYFNKLKATLKQAYKEGYLQSDLNAKIEPIKQAETRRNFLTIEELNSLIKTECIYPVMKQAALFSALTGLRFSDIQKLIWGEIEFVKGQGYYIRFKQQKTKGIENLPISEQAYNLMGERKEPKAKVFEGLTYSAYSNKYLYQWIGAAGISKDITFHCFRHTFATLQLSKGTDLYTVSKMLGHRDIQTTQIYAKIINKTTRKAADKIKLNF